MTEPNVPPTDLSDLPPGEYTYTKVIEVEGHKPLTVHYRIKVIGGDRGRELAIRQAAAVMRVLQWQLQRYREEKEGLLQPPPKEEEG